MTDREEMIRTLKDKSIRDTELAASRQRFALFSQPVSIAIGDDSYDYKQIPERDEQGKPVTMLRNPCASALKKGKDTSVYFSKVSYTTIGDLYIDPDRRKRLDELQKKQQVKEDSVFKPASGYKTMTASAYDHKSDYVEKERNYRDSETGHVMTQPTNPLVGIRGVQESTYKFPQFMPEPYERKREMERAERMAHHQLLGEKPCFKTTHHGNEAFSNDKNTFGCDVKIPEKKERVIQYNILKHEVPFKPSHPPKKGYNGCLNKYPPYKGNPIRVPTRIDKESNREIFKPSHAGNLSRPTPTITCNKINIRREMASTSHRI